MYRMRGVVSLLGVVTLIAGCQPAGSNLIFAGWAACDTAGWQSALRC